MRMWRVRLAVALALWALVAPVGAADIGREMEREYGVVSRDTEEGVRLNARLDRIVGRVTDALGFKVKRATLLGGRSAKKDKVINAFALPDGRIYVLVGLLRAVEPVAHPDAALAFVVGHEVTHVKEKHGKHQQRKSITAALLGAGLAAMLGARGGAIGDWGNLAGNVIGSHYSRVDEYRADKGGLIAMQKAGYEMDGAVELLQVLEKEGGEENKTINGWLGSHPITRNRIARVRELRAEIEKGSTPETPSEKELQRDDKGRSRD
jgi:predicted Zn-dependent protease